MRRSVALETLGCKVNQYESSYLIEQLADAGYELVSFRHAADVYVVHSCAVTAKAGFQTRQLLRRAQRLNPQASIVVAGCAAQVEPGRFTDSALATHVLGTNEKYDLVHWLETPATLQGPCCAVGQARSSGPFRITPVAHMAARARAFLKIQDGCDAFCSYCIVPFSRGVSRSLPLEEVRAQLLRFRDAGYGEVVLSGIHLGQWGKDLRPTLKLLDLLGRLQEVTAAPRLRLSSLETLEWRDGMLDGMSQWQKICPHFHIPLQSGNAEILQRMHRPYSPQEFVEVIQELHCRYPLAALGTDVLAGFPGETDRCFGSTMDLIERLPLSYLHVFPYSPRPGTEAAGLSNRVTGAELKRRTRALRELGLRKQSAFHQQFLEKTVEVLVENQVRAQAGWYQGTTDNYLKVAFPAPVALASGTRVRVRIRQMTQNGLRGGHAEMMTDVP